MIKKRGKMFNKSLFDFRADLAKEDQLDCRKDNVLLGGSVPGRPLLDAEPDKLYAKRHLRNFWDRIQLSTDSLNSSEKKHKIRSLQRCQLLVYQQCIPTLKGTLQSWHNWPKFVFLSSANSVDSIGPYAIGMCKGGDKSGGNS